MNRRVKNWDPAQYRKFAAERMRPVEDLLARMTMEAPATVYDLGCGDGRVARLLATHWPEARITGVDNSANMLDAARKVQPEVTWIKADIAHWAPDAPAQVVFANASLQWLSGHESLLPRLMDMSGTRRGSCGADDAQSSQAVPRLHARRGGGGALA